LYWTPGSGEKLEGRLARGTVGVNQPASRRQRFGSFHGGFRVVFIARVGNSGVVAESRACSWQGMWP
jgi:hypothetical protein